LLVGWLGDHRDDPAASEMLPDRTGRVRLVTARPVRSGARSARTASGDSEVIHQHREHRRIAALPGTDEDDQWKSATIDEVMDLRAQTASRPANRMVSRLRAPILATR